MADKKISQLSVATTPLAGTEVLPIVQSGATVQVSVDNLTSGKAVGATSFNTETATAKVTLSGTSLVASGSNSNIDINVTPKGTGSVVMPKSTISGGTIDGVSIGATTPATYAKVDNISIDGNTISATNTDGSVSVSVGGLGNLYLNDTTGVWTTFVKGLMMRNAAAVWGYDDGGASAYGIGMNYTNGKYTQARIAYSQGIDSFNQVWNSTIYSGSVSAGGAVAGGKGVYMNSSGDFYPAANNTNKLGISGNRWSEVFAVNGTINTSDARKKTAVQPLTVNEISAAKQLAKEIGTFQFLDAVAAKGDAARHHVGMTVQRAIEIMEANNLDPMAYGFICYDEWEDRVMHYAADPGRSEIQAQPAEYEEQVFTEIVIVDGEQVILERKKLVCVKEEVEYQPAIAPTPSRDEVVAAADNEYGFRTDQLLMFIARGFDARLAALENA